MAKEELLPKIETFVNGVLETLLQDKNSIVERIDEELKDFIISVGFDCAEPREKRITELEMTVGTLRNFSNEQATCIEKLETQIEKMKCCSMCKYYSMRFLPYFCTKNNTSPHCTSKCDKWEMKENERSNVK